MSEVKISGTTYNLIVPEDIINMQYKYIFCENFFTPEECQKIISSTKEKRTFTPEELQRDDLGYTYKTRTNGVIYPIFPENIWYEKKLTNLVQYLNKRYFMCNISDVANVQMIEYKQNCNFEWHIDMLPGRRGTSLISIVCFLSNPEDYEGGRLIWKPLEFGINKQEQLKGTLVFFSAAMEHSVETVTKGTRYSLVSFGYNRFWVSQ